MSWTAGYPDQPPKQTGNGTAQWKPGKWLLPSTLKFPVMLKGRMWRWLSWQSACLESTETGTGSPEPMWKIWARWHAPVIPAREEVGTGGCLVGQPSLHDKFQITKDPVLEKPPRGWHMRSDICSGPLASISMRVHMCTCIHGKEREGVATQGCLLFPSNFLPLAKSGGCCRGHF